MVHTTTSGAAVSCRQQRYAERPGLQHLPPQWLDADLVDEEGEQHVSIRPKTSIII